MFEILPLCWHYFKRIYISSLTLVYVFIFYNAMVNWIKRRSKKTRKKIPSQSFIGILIFYLHIVCLLETYLNSYQNWIRIEFHISAYQKHTWILQIDWYGVIWFSSCWSGGVRIYYKESLPVRVISLSYFKKAFF